MFKEAAIARSRNLLHVGGRLTPVEFPVIPRMHDAPARPIVPDTLENPLRRDPIAKFGDHEIFGRELEQGARKGRRRPCLHPARRLSSGHTSAWDQNFARRTRAFRRG